MTEELRIQNSSGEILARENFILAFFGNRPFAEMAEGTREVLTCWLKLIPETAIQWAVVGKSAVKYKNVTPKLLDRCLAMLDSDVAMKNDVYFRIMGPQPYGPDYRALISGYIKPKKVGFANETNLIEFLFPLEFCTEWGEDHFVEMAASMFDALVCDSGYAGPALHYGIRGEYDSAREFIAPLALRHHGYDVPNNPGTAVFMGRRSRGARWLTMLSAAFVDELGGPNLKARVADGVEIRELAKGILLRAGSKPEIGDVNRNELTPLLVSVAHAIEGVTYFHDNSVLPIFSNNKEQRDRWERRFWWKQD
ncbi:MAG: DUF3396 domain-containing protein [Nitrososphaera sp.]|nr:DUF3396 domain-containing protein [Nitrososphaera sp.]